MDIKKYKVLARLMGKTKGHKGVAISIHGKGAWTNCKDQINLPAGDLSDPRYIALLEGVIDHEAGHISHSDINLVKEAVAISPLVNHLRNVFEDIRMENCVCAEYKGAYQNLFKMVDAMIDMELFSFPTEDMEKIELIFCVALYFGRYHYRQQTNLKEFALKSKDLLIAAGHEELLVKVCLEMEALDKATVPRDSLLLAIKVVNLLQDDEPEDDGSDDKSEDDGSDDKSDDDGSDDKSDDDGSDDKSDDDGSGNKSEKDSSDIMPEFGDDFDPVDFHEIANQALQMLSEEAHDMKTAHVFVTESNHEVRKQVQDMSESKYLANKIYPTLNKKLIAEKRSQSTWSKRGSTVDEDRLCGVATGQYDVFVKKTKKQKLSAAISILVDKSGSMWSKISNEVNSKTHQHIANISALALVQAVDRVKGAVAECNYFDTKIHSIKTFTQKTNPLDFCILESGKNIVNTGLTYTIQNIVMRKETKKIIIVVTDGDTAFEETEIANAILEAKKHGVYVCAIGINYPGSKIAGFDDFQLLSDSTELPIVMKKLLDKLL